MKRAFSATVGALLVFGTVSGAPVAIAPSAPGPVDGEQPSCTMADTELFAERAIDTSTCGLDGIGDEAHRAQNRAKNNLCVGGFLTSSPTAIPARITQFSFRRLQTAATAIRKELGIGPRTVPADRSRFQNMVHTTSFGDDVAEGTLVRYVGFLLEAHFTGEEGVNCDRRQVENHDVHMAFVEQRPPVSPSTAEATALECSSITAEIIPRRRPGLWGQVGGLSKTRSAGLRGALRKIAAHDLDRPFRITGQLFFDASHETCRNGRRVGGQPARVSNWEIHPVYEIKVCDFRSMASCRFDREEVWRHRTTC